MAGILPTMTEFDAGELHSGSKNGPMVKSRKQAIAIGLSSARRAGQKVPPPRASPPMTVHTPGAKTKQAAISAALGRPAKVGP